MNAIFEGRRELEWSKQGGAVEETWGIIIFLLLLPTTKT
jgi:hypothetical protein